MRGMQWRTREKWANKRTSGPITRYYPDSTFRCSFHEWIGLHIGVLSIFVATMSVYAAVRASIRASTLSFHWIWFPFFLSHWPILSGRFDIVHYSKGRVPSNVIFKLKKKKSPPCSLCEVSHRSILLDRESLTQRKIWSRPKCVQEDQKKTRNDSAQGEQINARCRNGD